MQFTRGNLALRDHLNTRKRVFLFEFVKKGFVRFLCEVEFYDSDYSEAIDRNGQKRTAIKFFFKRKGAYVPEQPKLLSSVDQAADPVGDYGFRMPNETERKGLVTSRVGQGAYRKRIIHRWEYKCAVTQFDKLDVLVASHIVPWAEADDNERLDVNNGILLSPTYDALFDRHLITFGQNGKIILSEEIEKRAFQKIGVNGEESIKNLSVFNHDYLDRHRNRFYEAR